MRRLTCPGGCLDGEELRAVKIACETALSHLRILLIVLSQLPAHV